jgi:hypothetical protein
MKHHILYALIAAALVACSGGHSETQGQATSAQVSGDGGSCSAPSAATTYSDASASGCYQRSRLMVCPVPNGSVVELNGSVETPDGAVVTCTDTCSQTEYTLNCSGPTQADQQPDPSLNCQVITLPTPQGQLNYCCPCSP